MGQHFWWYVARSCGFVAFALLTMSVSFGLVLSTRLFGRSVAPAWLLELHRYLGALGVIATGMHMSALVADTYVTFTIKDLFVPFSSHWKTVPVAWGILAFWLLILIESTSLLMRKLPRKVWRRIHMTSFGLYAAALVHGLQAGTDGRMQVVEVTAIAFTMTVIFLSMVRALAPRRAARREAATRTASREAATRTASRAAATQVATP